MSRPPSKQASVWVSHPTSNAFVRAAVDAFYRNGMLDTFHTCVALGADCENKLLNKLLGQRRCPVPARYIKAMPTREFMRLLFQRLGAPSFLWKHETGPLCIDQVYLSLDEMVARRLLYAMHKPAALYAYEDGAMESFKTARELGIACIYDLPIGYWRTALKIQNEEAGLKPEWARTMPALRDSAAKLERKDDELQAADSILVASEFTARTLRDAPFTLPVPTVIPYGCPPAVSLKEASCALERHGKLKVLYVGSLSQRKGLAYLLDAVARLNGAVELTLVGKRIAECPPLDHALRHYHWIESLPHADVMQTMRRHDVLVLPSLFEGSGLVLTEALSQGLPIVTTPHTCAPDIIEDGKEGFIVPIRCVDGITEKLALLHADRDRLQAMKEAALATARRFKWESYQRGLVAAVKAALTRYKESS